MSNSIASKIPEKRINNLKAFSSVMSEIQQNTHCLLTVSKISSTIFQKVRMAAFVHSLSCQVLWFYNTWQWLHCDADINAVYCHTYCKVLKTNKIMVTSGNWEPSAFPTCSFSRADLWKAMWALPELCKLQQFFRTSRGEAHSPVAVPLQICFLRTGYWKTLNNGRMEYRNNGITGNEMLWTLPTWTCNWHPRR